MSVRDELDVLLDKAQRRSPNDRIGLRDEVAAHGAEAIRRLTPWLGDPALRTFAILAIGRAGGQDRDAAIAALRAIPANAPAHVIDDVDRQLALLGASRQRIVSSPAPALNVGFNEDLYQFLVVAASVGRLVSYTEAGEIVGLTMRNPHHRRLIGALLGEISNREAEAGRPMLSSIVVTKDQQASWGTGFFALAEELRRKQIGEDPDSFGKAEAARTFDYWRGRSNGAIRGTATGAPDYRNRTPNESPPPALGPCEFTGADGQCANPGRWDRYGHLSCTTHAKAKLAKPFDGRPRRT